MKNSSDTIGNRTLNQLCHSVLQKREEPLLIPAIEPQSFSTYSVTLLAEVFFVTLE